MSISKEVLDELLKNYKGPSDLTGTEGILKEKSVASDLKNIHTAPSQETATISLENFAEKWDKSIP
jgi:heme oxygenase